MKSLPHYRALKCSSLKHCQIVDFGELGNVVPYMSRIHVLDEVNEIKPNVCWSVKMSMAWSVSSLLIFGVELVSTHPITPFQHVHLPQLLSHSLQVQGVRFTIFASF